MLILLAGICAAAPPPHCHGQDLARDDGAGLPCTDTLELRLLDLEIQEARREAERLSVWHRLIPRLRLSASLGVSETFQDDPGTVVLPRDAYRLSVSLSLNEVFDAGPQEKALFRLERLQTERALLRRRQENAQRTRETETGELLRTIEAREEEIAHRERIARFYQMRFEQGGVDYPSLARAELDVMALREDLRSLKARLSRAPAASRRRPAEEPP